MHLVRFGLDSQTYSNVYNQNGLLFRRRKMESNKSSTFLIYILSIKKPVALESKLISPSIYSHVSRFVVSIYLKPAKVD